MATADPLTALAGTCPLRAAGDPDHVNGVRAGAVATPGSTAQVAALLRSCHDHGLAVTVRGAGSKLHWGMPPARLDVLLDTAALTGVTEHAHGDLVVTVGAGTALADLQGALGQHAQQLLVDDMTGSSTVGGAIATAMSGPRRPGLGTPRDLLIGLTMVRADGTVAKSGGKVVKNVAGYDLGKLLVGSFGTLAVVTEATFRLHPVPEASRWVYASVPVPHIPDALRALTHTQLVPAAVEIEHNGPTNAHATVAVLLTGTAGGVRSRSAAFFELLPGADTADRLAWPGRYPWAESHGKRGRQEPTCLKLTGRLSAVPDLVRAAIAEGGHVRGSAAAGVLYVDLARSSDPVTSVGRLRQSAVAAEGSLVVLEAPDAVREVVDLWGPVGGLELMRRLKKEFDPAGILSPGRFVGGI